MTSNNRFPGHRGETEDRNSALRAKPVGLSRAEVALDTDTVRYAEDAGIPVTVWIRYPETAVRQDGQAWAWTDRAGLVQIEGAGGAERLWVWASAVRRR